MALCTCEAKVFSIQLNVFAEVFVSSDLLMNSRERV